MSKKSDQRPAPKDSGILPDSQKQGTWMLPDQPVDKMQERLGGRPKTDRPINPKKDR